MISQVPTHWEVLESMAKVAELKVLVTHYREKSRNDPAATVKHGSTSYLDETELALRRSMASARGTVTKMTDKT